MACIFFVISGGLSAMTFGNWFILASLCLSFESLLGCVLDYLLLCLSMHLSGLSIRRYFYSF